MLHAGICSFLQRPVDGAVFAANELPLHLTVLGNFRIDANLDLIVDAVEVCARVLPVESFALGDERFGPRGEYQVTEAQLTAPLRELHDSLRGWLEDAGARLDEPSFAGDGYRPHVTWQGGRPFGAGTPILLSTLSIVDLAPDGDSSRRLVAATL